ncbi:MAG: hypothetical protein GY917_03385, partial [Planctomycetaceae bacterium]|nr:hypothetical protein [Planctomycetaceae bacterium]
VQNRAADAAWTSGYGNSPPGGTSLDNDYFSVAIDTYPNPWDPNNWHMEWGYDGFGQAESNLNQTPLPDTKNSNVHTITIDYNATAKRFSAFYDDTLVIESDLDLGSTISLDNGTAYIGCMGICGGPAESHEILSWEFARTGGGLDVVSGDVVDLAVPGTYQISYNSEDLSGNAADQVIRTVIVQD